jgi:hypothetical protein
MNPYALPSFCAFPLLFVLGLAVILQNPRDKISRLLFFLYLILALQSGAAGMLHQSTSEVRANFWNKWPYIFALPSMALMMEYATKMQGCSYIFSKNQLSSAHFFTDTWYHSYR